MSFTSSGVCASFSYLNIKGRIFSELEQKHQGSAAYSQNPEFRIRQDKL
jgi:hypothetical protein